MIVRLCDGETLAIDGYALGLTTTEWTATDSREEEVLVRLRSSSGSQTPSVLDVFGVVKYRAHVVVT